MAKQKVKEKAKVRESKPLAETPDYNSTDLADNLKKIQSDSNARIAASQAERRASSNKRREAMSSKGRQSGGSLAGLGATFGSKIVK